MHNPSQIQLHFKSLRPTAKLPSYATKGSAAIDLCAAEPALILPGQIVAIPTGFAVQIPEGHVLKLYSRSGHALSYGITLANSVGIIDSDFRGELVILLRNDGYCPFQVSPGDRIAQAILLRIPQILPILTNSLSETDRGEGGFGSTGA